jgi:Adenomatosis polyposis coli down-regulated 1
MLIQHVLGVFVAGLVLSGVNSQNPSQSSITGISIAGIWESERCDVQERNGRQTSSRSVFVFLDGEWALEFTQYSDAACTTPSLRAFFHGRYRIAEPSSAVAGAYHATFGFSVKRLTLYDDGLLAQANRGTCGTRTWTRGREEDVSSTGCLWVVPVSACREEFDLVKLEGERLLLGERPAAGTDLCHADRRARALRSLPLVRRVRALDAVRRD